MSNELYVLNEGVSIPTLGGATFTPSNLSQLDTSVNPNLVSNIPQATAETAEGLVSFYEIHEDEQTTMRNPLSIVSWPTQSGSALDTYGSNAHETPGYRVVLETASALNLSTTTYYILVYADNMYKHHFAKITEEVSYEGDFNTYDFTPRLKENIPKNTKVMIFSAPTTSPVALAYGLMNDDSGTEERHDRYVNVSRPTFYFLEGDSLKANTKYTAVRAYHNNNDGSNQKDYTVFRTATETSDMILDKSFYTQNATVKDANRDDDDTDWDNTHSFFDSWTNAFSRYASHPGDLDTYMKFISSPLRNQTVSTPVGVKLDRSITARGNIFEIDYMDPERFLDKKIQDMENIKILEFIGSDNINSEPSFALPGVFNNHDTDTDKIVVTGLLEGQDLSTLLEDSGSFEFLYIGNYYYIISNITSPVGGSQTITITDKRLYTSNTFSGSAVVESLTDATGYRRRIGSVVSNIGVTHSIDTEISGSDVIRNDITIETYEADVYDLEYIVGGNNQGIQLLVNKGDRLNSYTELQTTPSSIFNSTGSLLDCIRTNISYNKKMAEGRVEFKEVGNDGGVFRLKISGRDILSQLLGSPVNKNYTYTNEYVYSTLIPGGDRIIDTGLEIDTGTAFGANTITVTTTIGSEVAFGDVLFTSSSGAVPLGVVKSVSGSVITLFKDVHITDHTIGELAPDDTIYRAPYGFLAGKSLETYNGSVYDTKSETYVKLPKPTTLLGSVDKGFIFNTGKYYEYDGSNVIEGGNLSSVTSANTDNGNAIDNLITSVVTNDGVHADVPIGIDITERKDTISSMVDFDILNQERGENQITFTLGYISPLVLGRMSEYVETADKFLEELAGDYVSSFYLINGQGLPKGGFLHLLNNEVCSTTKGPMTFTDIIVDDGGMTTVSPAVISDAQYDSRFNPSIWRYTNKTKGEFINSMRTVGTASPTRLTNHNDIYQTGTNFNFYLSAYKMCGNEYFIHNQNRDETTSYLIDKPTEMLGIKPAVGSRFWDIDRYPAFAKDRDIYDNIDTDDMLEHYSLYERWDDKTGALHFFLPGDIYPESQTNWNNIGYDSRPLSDYSLILKNKETTVGKMGHNTDTGNPTHWDGVSKHGNRLDTDYAERKIIDYNGDLNRFNIARLIELTFDSYFNEVDYENYDLNRNATPNTDEILADTYTTLVYGSTGVALNHLRTGKFYYPVEEDATIDIPNATIAQTNYTANNGIIMKLPVFIETIGSPPVTTVEDKFVGSRFITETQVDSFEGYQYIPDMDMVILDAKIHPDFYTDGEDLQSMQNAFLETASVSLTDSGAQVDFKGSPVIDQIHGFQNNNGFMEEGQSSLTSNGHLRAVRALFKPKLSSSDWQVIDNTGGVDWSTHLKSDEAVLEIVVETSSGGSRHWIHYCNNLTGNFLYDSTNQRLHYIKSHTVSKTDTTNFSHYLKIDNFVTGSLGTELIPLRLSQNCFYDFTPERIVFNALLGTYTKVPGKNETFSWAYAPDAKETDGGIGIHDKEHVRSMYVVINIDDKTANKDKYLVSRTRAGNNLYNTFGDNYDQTVYITDGVNTNEASFYNINTETSGLSVGYSNIRISPMKAMKGCPSIGKIIEVTVSDFNDFTPSTATIAASFDVVYEAEEIVDDILSSIDIDYTKSTVGNDYYLSANFNGQNAYSAANSILQYVDKKLFINGNDVVVVSNQEDKFYRNIEFNEDSNEYNITSIKRDKSLFDEYNVVVVYGDGVRSTARNYSSIKSRGKEITKEVYDYTVSNQTQADSLAQSLLKIYSRVNDAIEIRVGSDIPFLQPGHIVSVYYPSEGIYRAPYVVLETEKKFGSPSIIKLGEYNKDLANTMSMLLSETRNLQGFTKKKVYASTITPNIILNQVRLKFVKAEITNLTDTTTSTIGFGYTIGFDSEVGP